MKTILKAFLLLGLFAFVSCDSKGPQSHSTFPDRSSEELLQDIMEAAENDSYYYKRSVELYYKEDGEWEYYGTREVYGDPNGTHECNDWVRFGDDLMPVYYTNKGGYTFTVKYMGVDYYY